MSSFIQPDTKQPTDRNHSKVCKVCQTSLTGLRRVFCSNKCKGRDSNFTRQSYEAQQARATERKLKLLALKGGCCEVCGYARNSAALCFHHVDPSTKDFSLDSRKLSNSTYESLLVELEKCQLLCHNCHMEIHHPHFTKP